MCRAKQQNLEERQADVEYELRCLLNKPGLFGRMLPVLYCVCRRAQKYLCEIWCLGVVEKEWTDEDKNREQELMADLVTIIEERNQIVNSMDQDRQR